MRNKVNDPGDGITIVPIVLACSNGGEQMTHSVVGFTVVVQFVRTLRARCSLREMGGGLYAL